jgi:arsenate reductase
LFAANEEIYAVIKSSVLFLCTGNSRRTQMAEGFLRALAGDEFDVVSAGSEETPLDPDAVAAMSEVGIDISGHEPKAVNRYLGRRFSYVVMLCDRQKERSCPIFPGAIWRLHWDLEDPSRVAAAGDRREAMRRVRDDIQRHVMDFVKKNGVTKGKEQPA